MLKIRRNISEIYSFRFVLKQLISQHLILRYRKTALGYLWTLVNPLLMMSVMALVFSNVYKIEFKSFALFLFAGMIPWNYFSACVTQSSGVFIQNEGLIKKIYLPKAIFPLSISLALIVDSLFSLVALLLIMICLGAEIDSRISLLPLGYLLLYLFSCGVGLFVSVATVYFRDLQHITQIGLQGLFFLTPILYKTDTISGMLAGVLFLNPMVSYVNIFRFAIGVNNLNIINELTSGLLYALLSMCVGYLVYEKNKKNIVFRL